jgi:actin-like ATPase involved in cell morphogenesis
MGQAVVALRIELTTMKDRLINEVRSKHNIEIGEESFDRIIDPVAAKLSVFKAKFDESDR